MKRTPMRIRLRRLMALIVVFALLLCTMPISVIAEAAAPLRFSELQSDNGGTLILPHGAAPDWIEIQNTGSAPISLKGISVALETKPNKAFTFPEMMLASGEFALIIADGQTGARDGYLHAGFRLSASGGQTLLLFDAANRLMDRVVTPELKKDAAYCRVDGGDWQVSLIATPNERNILAANADAARALNVTPGGVELSEAMSANAMSFPDENGAFHDYVELHNTTADDINLAGYFLSDDASRPMKWQFPSVILPADGYLAVHCSGLDRRDDPAHLHTGFKISAEGETILLSDADQTLISAVRLPALKTGTAYSRSGDSWTTLLPPTPNRENTFDAHAASAGAAVCLSEISAIGAGDDDMDWIELYNASAQAVDLCGYALSDNPAKPRKWQFPAGIVLQPNACLCVVCSASGEITIAGRLNAGFALSSDGGYPVCLAAPDGTILDSIYLPVQYAGYTYGRNPQTRGCGYFLHPSPEAPNMDAPCSGLAASAQYSVSGGVFASDEAFSVALSAESNARIYYTLDCTDPSEASTLYDGAPIPVQSTTILRTRVYQDGLLPSLTNTQSYLFDIPNATDVDYVVSLISDPDNLFSDARGIMAMGPNAEADFPYGDTNRGANFWMDWEREAHVELFRDGAEPVISQNCGIRMHGRNTRAYELKSFKVLARARYGDSRFRYPIFSNRDFPDCDSFTLRYAGQDYKYTFMRDPVFTRLARGTEVLYQESELCLVYLNGQYYSAMYIRETVDPDFICQSNGWQGSEDQIDIVKGAIHLLQGSDADYAELKAWLESHDNATQETFDRINAIIDIDSFIQFTTLTIVLEPPDTVDVKRYRNSRTGGKWRWIIYDFDRCLREDLDGFELMAQGAYRTLFKAFMVQPELRERFLDYFAQSLAEIYTPAHLTEIIEAQLEKLKPVLPDYLANLGVSVGRYKEKYGNLRSKVKRVSGLAIQQCAKYLHLSEAEVNARFADAIQAIQAFNAS